MAWPTGFRASGSIATTKGVDMLTTACVGFGLSVGLWLHWCQRRPNPRDSGLWILGLALGLSHAAFLLLSAYHFTKG
jgi:hypothetical protein